MKPSRLIAALSVIAALGGCGASDMVGRQATLSPSTPGTVPEGATVALMPLYDVRDIRIDVPRDLSVSEANAYFPVADIVWRGEPRADRHAQVAAIFKDALTRSTARMTSGPAVVVEATVTRFHALSEKARYSVGGVHTIGYALTVRDAADGTILDGPRAIKLNFRASGGQKALEEESRGLTQRVVVLEELTRSILRELSAPTVLPQDVPVTRIGSEMLLSLSAVSMKNELLGN